MAHTNSPSTASVQGYQKNHRETSASIYLLYCYFRIHHRESYFPHYNILWWYIGISYYLDAATLVRLMVSPLAESYTSCVQPFNHGQFCHSEQQFAIVHLANSALYDFTIHLCHKTLKHTMTGVASLMKEYTSHT